MWKDKYAAQRIELGLKLRSFREAQGMTLVDLSARSGMSVSSLSRNENGDRDISLIESARICTILGNRDAGVACFVEVMIMMSDTIRFGHQNNVPVQLHKKDAARLESQGW